MIVPIVGNNNRIALVNQLDIDVAGRFDHYSDVGSTTNPKISARWKPVQDLAIHADYGTSFRAPTLCDTSAGCSAGDLASTTAYGPGVNVITILGGNAAVKPETATTWTLGGDFRPAWLNGFDASINYFHVDYKNVIGTPGQNGASVLTNPLYSSLVIANPTQAQINSFTSQSWFTSVPFQTKQGVVSDIILGTRQNSGEIQNSGLDLTVGYNWATPWGNLGAGADGTYNLVYNYEVLPGLGLIDRLNQANYPVTFRGRARFSWSIEHLSAIVYWNYTSSYQVVGLAYATQKTPVNSYSTVDATVLYKFNGLKVFGRTNNDLTLSLSVQNLINSPPPFALIGNSQEFDSQQASALGRLITLGVRVAF